MAQQIADLRDIEFVLFEQLDAEKLTQHQKFKRFNRKLFDLIINEARNLAIKEILPTFMQGDREGVQYDNGDVKVPQCYHRPYALLKEGGWIAMTQDPSLGGQGLPNCIARAAAEYLYGANPAFGLYADVPQAAGELIANFGTPEQKDLFLEKMYSGQWSGTMQLTEPQAGSDVGALTTSAAKQADGTYLLSGSKIFITAGDQDLTENIIHPVLARIEGAPPGIKGISLFLVPKIRVDNHGRLGQPNDIICTGIIEKMGLHGSSTCNMALGTHGRCKGLLLGEANKGIRMMFQMMNTARLAVGHVAAVCGSFAYLLAANYARERLQGRALHDISDPSAHQVPIIAHPDVRRMLVWMKSHVDGMRSIIYYVSWVCDRMSISADAEEKESYQRRIDLLTPVIKSYCADRGFDICVEAMQVYGGYGYTKDYPIEQLLRDCKVNSIYEGTNGIQAIDFLGRKLGMQQGAVFAALLEEMGAYARLAKKLPELVKLAGQFESVVQQLGETATQIGAIALSPKIQVAYAHAKPFLDVFGDVCMAWMHIWRATAAASRLEKLAGTPHQAKKAKMTHSSDVAFYKGVVQTAEFFIRSVLPVSAGKMASIMAFDPAAVEIAETSLSR